MIVEFRVKNFKSFKEEQTLSFVASGGKTTLPENCRKQGQLNLLTATAIYGPNASGKSNIIKALGIMRGIVLDSADYKPGQDLPVVPFIFDEDSKNEPTLFEVVFVHEGVRYQYGFTATSKRIVEEWLIAYPKNRAQTWFERPSKDADEWKFSTYFKGEKAGLQEKTRENALFLSVGPQWNNEQLTTVYNWFKEHLRVVTTDFPWAPITEDLLLVAEEGSQEANSFRKVVLALLKEADLGICDISVDTQDVDETKLPEFSSDDYRKKVLEKLKNNPPRIVKMAHENKETGQKYFLSFEEESKGTQVFFKLIGPWLMALAHGITVVIDEIESSLHPLLTRELINMMQNPETNTKGAQLVFATHDTTLLDPELLRRDQIWFTEKDKAGVTNLYSMADYKVKARKGEAMQKRYLFGRYGAIPVLEAFSLNE